MISRVVKKIFKLIIILALIGGVIFLASYILLTHRKVAINQFFTTGATKGVDISGYQADVDMSELKNQNIGFIYIKATEGSSYVDDYFEQNWSRAKAASLPAGAYHFFSFESSGKTQAENYIKTVGDLSGRLIPVVDVELYGNYEQGPPDVDKVATELKAFISAIENHYHTKPMIYTQPDIRRKYLSDFQDYPWWIRSVFFPAWLTALGGDWTLWQYSDRGELSGYSGGEKFIDLNILNTNKSLSDINI